MTAMQTSTSPSPSRMQGSGRSGIEGCERGQSPAETSLRLHGPPSNGNPTAPVDTATRTRGMPSRAARALRFHRHNFRDRGVRRNDVPQMWP